MPRERSKHELRCPVCRQHPLLATFGLDEHGEVYVHVKVYKQHRIYAEVLVTRGTVKLCCRDCFRWHKVVIRKPEQNPILEETLVPPVVATL